MTIPIFVNTVAARRHRRPARTAVVVAIDPAPFAIAALQETVAMNDLTNIRLVAAAVSDRAGEFPLFVAPSHALGLTTTVARRDLFVREQGRVRALPLGSLVTARSWRPRA